MKKLILLLSLIYISFCSMESCNDILDQEKCNDEPIDQDGFYCFKANIKNDITTKCMTFPTDPAHQKIYFRFVNGIIKESLSSYGNLEGKLQFLLSQLESQLMQSSKESYNTDETIQIGPGKLSNEEKTIINSEQTCSYYYFGRYYKQFLSPFYDGGPYRKYENINDL